MKKLLAVLLALVMLVSLAACAGNTDKDNPSSDAPANSDNPSMKANVNKTSGNFTNDFAESAGDSSQPCDLSFDIISGNLEVLGVE